MICKNCNNNLSGTEDYCPFCGTPQKFPDLKVASAEESEKEHTPQATENSIFQSEPVYIYAEPPKTKKDSKTKLATILVSIFLLTLLVVGGFSLSQYFSLTPAFSSLFSTLPTETTITPTLETTTETEFDNTIGLVSPDISFRSTLCVITSDEGLPLRKGPDNAFAQIDFLSKGTSLQAMGKSLNNNLWVYVYVPSSDVYGWVSGSYISQNSALTEPSSAVYNEADPETTKN